MIRVIASEPPSGLYMTIRIGADSRDELDNANARDFAKQECMKQGFNARGLSNTPVIYPVNDKGEATDAVALGQEKVAWWESEFKFTTGI